MIPYNELRIGNYVFYEDSVVRIAMINHKEAPGEWSSVSTGGEKKFASGLSFESIQPVPLSDVVLERCNFIYHDYFKFWQLVAGSGEYRSEMDIDGDFNVLDFMRRPIVKKVASLHQMQNIYFMLKGKELHFQHDAKGRKQKV
jgi:hypothetical protein